MQGVVVFSFPYSIHGTVVLTQFDEGVEIEIDLVNLNNQGKKSYHGFHIHKSGDLRRGCDSCCKHYNPTKMTHGGLHDIISHAGDLGNISFNKEGICKKVLHTDKFMVQDIIGRSLIIHEDKDDLGKGHNEDSKNTGNSGKRIACSIIGYSENTCE